MRGDGCRRLPHPLHRHHPPPVYPDGRRLPDPCLPVNVLVAVDDQARLVLVDVVGQGVKALVDAVLAVVDAARAVVRDQDVHRREVGQELMRLGLVVEESPLGLVLPAAVEPADAKSANLDHLEVQVFDGIGERRVMVMIALDRQNPQTAIRLRRLQDELVTQVTAGQQ